MAITDWSNVVGMPDEQDKKQIELIIRIYDKTHPGEIGRVVAFEKQQERENSGGLLDPFLVKNKHSDLRKVLAMPPDLVGAIKDGFPTIFKDKKHFRWFVRNFPIFRVADKY